MLLIVSRAISRCIINTYTIETIHKILFDFKLKHFLIKVVMQALLSTSEKVLQEKSALELGIKSSIVIQSAEIAIIYRKYCWYY